MKSIKHLTFVIVIVLFASCSQSNSRDEQTITNNGFAEMVSPGSMRVIESYQQLFVEMDALNSMTFEELVAYEEGNGYKSFGRIADELLYSIDPDDFETQEEIFAFVEANSKYLMLVEDRDGELSLETTVWDNPYRYFINENREFVLEGKVFNATGGNIIAANHVEQVIYNNSLAGNNTPSFYAEYFCDGLNLQEVPETRAFGSPCSNPFIENIGYDKDKEERNRIILNCKIEGKYFQGITSYQMTYEVKAQKKTMGIWFQAERYLTFDLKMGIYWNGLKDVLADKKTNLLSRKYEKVIAGGALPGTAVPNTYFTGVDGLAYTREVKVDVDPAVIQCGTKPVKYP